MVLCTIKTSLFLTMLLLANYSLITLTSKKFALVLWMNTFQRTDPPQCTIVLRDRHGRLGNRLFMFASGFGLSRTYSCRLFIDKAFVAELHDSFNLHLPRFIKILPAHISSPVLKIDNRCSFIPRVIERNVSHFTELGGFWQVQKYFVNYTDEIRRQLRFKASILYNVNKFFKSAIRKNDITSVGMHIRRGDYINFRRISSVGFIFEAMNYFTQKYHPVHFIVATDDKPYCQKLFHLRNDVSCTPTWFSAAEDLAMLTLCDHVILTVGTFGWWGAFLNSRGGEVLTDSKRDFSPLDVRCRKDDFFPFWFSFLNNTN